MKSRTFWIGDIYIFPVQFINCKKNSLYEIIISDNEFNLNSDFDLIIKEERNNKKFIGMILIP